MQYYSGESYGNAYAHESSIKTLSMLLQESTPEVRQSLQHYDTAHTQVFHIAEVKKPNGAGAAEGKPTEKEQGALCGFCCHLQSRAQKGAIVKRCLLASLSPAMQLGDLGEKRRPRGAHRDIATCSRRTQEGMPMPHTTQTQ